MVRLFVDKLGTGHNDMFLKIEDKLSIADSYYLPDFLELEDEVDITTSLLCSHLIDYWISLIHQIEKDEPVFLPFDISDQYIGGILVTKLKKCIQLKKVFSQNIQGYSVNKSILKDFDYTTLDFEESSQTESLVNHISFLIDFLVMSKANL